ncbi:Hypothetical protein A7982_00078 [Minicystis rosea]|nr:Hypothetical protein A7982_00078 [Minicystis rosea]
MHRLFSKLLLLTLGIAGCSSSNATSTGTGGTSTSTGMSQGGSGGGGTGGNHGGGGNVGTGGTDPNVPAWAAAIPLRTWVELPNTEYLAWANANIPAQGYNGTGPISSIVDAYADPELDPETMKAYFFGGGHGDGTCNAVLEFDLHALKWRLAMDPTPVSAYPPSYAADGPGTAPGPLVYPSGLAPGYFSSTVTDPLDLPYKAPFDARPSTHQYAAHAIRKGVISYFYLGYAELDIAAKKWSHFDANPFGPQLLAIDFHYGDVPLQQGTVALYDDVTDRFFVTLNPGDAGGGWRSHLMRIQPETLEIETPMTEVPMTNSISLVKVDRWIYGFNKKNAEGGTTSMDDGWRYNIDSQAVEYLVVEGDPAIFTESTTQETVPAFLHTKQHKIYRWNYRMQDLNAMFELDLEPTGGTGTKTDPWRLAQKRTVMAGSPPQNSAYVYRRLYFDALTGLAMVLPRSNSNWFAIRM